jgi:hypothetical protein
LVKVRVRVRVGVRGRVRGRVTGRVTGRVRVYRVRVRVRVRAGLALRFGKLGVSWVSLPAHSPVLTRIMGEPWERTLVRKHAPRLNFVACG